jgi:hypothetical protein
MSWSWPAVQPWWSAEAVAGAAVAAVAGAAVAEAVAVAVPS